MTMFKLTTLALASVLLLASGCAAHDQRVALEQSCNNGDQNACQQIAQAEAPAPYPPAQTIRMMPVGQMNLGLPSGAKL
jgi:hypothetical protein